MFGPLYHGTTEQNLESILKNGFKVFVGPPRLMSISNGYNDTPYYAGIPAPVHHLGYGIYFTTSKTIAKQFSHGKFPKHEFWIDQSGKGMEVINFGAPRTMMDWWERNGYDVELAKQSESGRVEATKKLTAKLASKYDAVWFKGKGLHRLLDGDQVVVFDPSVIYGVDFALAGESEIGSTIEQYRKAKFVGDRKDMRNEMSEEERAKHWTFLPIDPPKRGKIVGYRDIPPEYRWAHPPGVDKFIEIKFDKGSRDLNAYPMEVRLVAAKRKVKSRFAVEESVTCSFCEWIAENGS